MNARVVFLLPLLSVVACSVPAPGEPAGQALCTPLTPAADSSLAAHPSLWALDSAPPLSAEQERLLAGIRARPTTAELHLAHLSPAADSLLRLGSRVVLTVSPGRSVVVVGDRVTRRGPSDVSWGGAIQGEWGRVELVLTSQGVTGSLQSAAKDDAGRLAYASYRIEPISGALEALVCVDASKYPPD
ncbi:MAG TPA: hypothetical protein VGQ06_14805 [Gemmatimonadales bacterium]|nr:hypothetical protein [Gemmatimonadales bacterium]